MGSLALRLSFGSYTCIFSCSVCLNTVSNPRLKCSTIFYRPCELGPSHSFDPLFLPGSSCVLLKWPAGLSSVCSCFGFFAFMVLKGLLYLCARVCRCTRMPESQTVVSYHQMWVLGPKLDPIELAANKTSNNYNLCFLDEEEKKTDTRLETSPFGGESTASLLGAGDQNLSEELPRIPTLKNHILQHNSGIIYLSQSL